MIKFAKVHSTFSWEFSSKGYILNVIYKTVDFFDCVCET